MRWRDARRRGRETVFRFTCDARPGAIIVVFRRNYRRRRREIASSVFYLIFPFYLYRSRRNLERAYRDRPLGRRGRTFETVRKQYRLYKQTMIIILFSELYFKTVTSGPLRVLYTGSC